MAPGIRRSSVVRFATFEVDLRASEVHKGGLRLKLSGQPFQVLAILLERPGEIVTREEFRKQLWPDMFVDVDHSLNTAVNKIRELLADSAENPRFVETVQRRGYRFIGEIHRDTDRAPFWNWRRLTMAGSLVACVLVIFGFNAGRLRRWVQEKAGVATIHSLAVLPLENLSGDSEQEYFVDGLTDELISRIARISQLRVISRTSSMRYKGTRKAIDEIANELNVEGIVEGTVLRSGNRVRITAQLIDTATDRHIWAENYEGDLQDIFTLQSRVAEAITGEVRVKIMPDKTGRTSTRLNPEAYEAYLKGRSYADRMTSATSEAAIRYYERAIELDSHFALANAYLAESLVLAGAGENSRKNLPRARAALDKALELDPTLSSAHTLLGMIHLSWEWDWEGAERECKRALELNPNDWAGHYGLAYYFHAMGRSREALAESDRALEIDPLSPRSITQNAYLLDCLRRHEEANRLYRKALELDPDFQRARYFLSWNDFRADLAAKNYIKAEIILRTALIQPKEQSATTRRMPSQNAATRNQEGVNGLRRLQQVLDSSDGMNFVRRASAYSLLSAKDQAMQCLEQAYDMRERGLTDLLSEPDLDPLHSDRRFQALARRMSLPPPS